MFLSINGRIGQTISPGSFKARVRVATGIRRSLNKSFYDFSNPFVCDGSPLCLFVHRVGMVGPVNGFQTITICRLTCTHWLSTDSSIKSTVILTIQYFTVNSIHKLNSFLGCIVIS